MSDEGSQVRKGLPGEVKEILKYNPGEGFIIKVRKCCKIYVNNFQNILN